MISWAARRASDTKLSHFARRPNKLIDMKTIRTEVIPLLSSKDKVVALTKFSKKIRTPIFDLCPRMGQKDAEVRLLSSNSLHSFLPFSDSRMACHQQQEDSSGEGILPEA